jgi:hypothetical protein
MQAKSTPIPLKLIILDTIGVILAGLGFAKYFGGIDVLPASLLLDQSGLSLIVIGTALMLPMMVWVIRRAKSSEKQ